MKTKKMDIFDVLEIMSEISKMKHDRNIISRDAFELRLEMNKIYNMPLFYNIEGKTIKIW